MSLNTCKIILENAEQKTTIKGVSCTTDIELYVFILTIHAKQKKRGFNR